MRHHDQNSLPVVVVTSQLEPEIRQALESPFTGMAEVVYVDDNNLNVSDLKNWKERARVLVFGGKSSKDFTYGLIGDLPKLEHIQLQSAGADYVDFTRIPKQITICSNVNGFSEPIAEYVLTMICSHYKNVVINHNELKMGIFSHHRESRSIMRPKVLIVGFGGIGKAVSQLLKQALNADIVAVNRSGKIDPLGVYDSVISLNSLAQSIDDVDIVVLSIPLNNQTKGLVDASLLEAMKKNALLINVARAGLINQSALYEHLRMHPSFGAVIDAWWIEPFHHGEFRIDYPFLDLRNVIGSPHNSFYSKHAFLKSRRMIGENIARFLSGENVTGRIDRNDYQNMHSDND